MKLEFKIPMRALYWLSVAVPLAGAALLLWEWWARVPSQIGAVLWPLVLISVQHHTRYWFRQCMACICGADSRMDFAISSIMSACAMHARLVSATDCHVAVTEIDAEITVSTVFLGVDHNFWDQGDPVLFETMVFGEEKVSHHLGRSFREELDQCRYSTWEEAERGHAEVCERVRAKLAEAGPAVDTAIRRTLRP